MNIDRPNIDRAMVSLFFEIKRNIPFDQRDQMKISSPLVGEQLTSIYKSSNDHALKALIEKFMDNVGGDWNNKLSTGKKVKIFFNRSASIVSSKIFTPQ